MKTNILLSLFAVVCANAAPRPWVAHGPLQVVAGDPHYLSHADGTRFWWFADTAWELIHRGTRPEVELYLDDRAAKGFNVFQTVILSEFLRNHPTDAYGSLALLDEDPGRPALSPKGNGFWDHVDFTVAAAAQRGLYVGLLPTWGEWVIPRNGSPLFKTTQQAYNYGWFVGNRFRTARNIIWILGGDRQPEERPEGVALWRAMAEGIADATNGVRSQDGVADYSTTLMTYHSFGSSSTWFHADPWIDLHLWGSYHGEYNNPRSWEAAEHDWQLAQPKPTINAEPCYERAALNYGILDNGRFSAVDVRIAAYWSVFSGAAGFTYGASPIWQMSSNREPASRELGSWFDALSWPGAQQTLYLKALLESRPGQHLRPARELIVGTGGQPATRTVVLRGDSHLVAYVPTGENLTLKLGVLSGERVRAWWFDPRKGTADPIGDFENRGEHTFRVPPMSQELAWLRTGRGCDWVLVLDDASRDWAAPGKPTAVASAAP